MSRQSGAQLAKAPMPFAIKWPRACQPAGSPPPREVATIVALLASPRMANVTGANWVIDGGLVKTV
jgi:NAD(P)-dependent dehydrogenase (short-subunit alcohol dehydrogenase family)